MISLDEHFGFICEEGSILVAVSGGSDSLALLHLANAWAISQSRELMAVTVDHGLRAESMAEAVFVANICDQLNISHAILGWDGEKPSAGVSEASRTARYRLIEEFAKDFGVAAVLTGHTSDDQAETINMRLQRDGGASASGRGLAGMCPRTRLMGGCVLLRPLLNLSRKQLREYLGEISQSWIEDPSNYDQSYERVRIREKLESQADLKRQTISFGKLMGRFRQCQAESAAKLLSACAVRENGQVFHIDLKAFNRAPKSVANLSLRSLIALIGGAKYLPSESKIALLLVQMGDTGGDIITKASATLGNCIIERHRSELVVYREMRNIDAFVIEPGDTAIWDGRLKIVNQGPNMLHIAQMDEKSVSRLEEAHGQNFDVTPRAALYASPVITKHNAELIAPHVDEVAISSHIEVEQCCRAIEAFCPQWDYSLVEWLKNVDQAKQKKASQH